VFLKINGRIHYLWRAVDQDGDVLDILVQSKRDKRAAKKFFRKLLKGLRYVPRVIITDKLRSYHAAIAEVLSGVEHVQRKYQNNRAENFTSTDQIAGARDETVQVGRSRTAFSFGFWNHYLTLPSRETSLQSSRLSGSHGVQVRDLERGDWGSSSSLMQEMVDQKDEQAWVDMI
jgi:IS1 family transposase